MVSKQFVLNKHQRRIKNAIQSLQVYMNTYDKQTGCLDYSYETFVDDVLYGLGQAINRTNYQWKPGFDLFKEHLKKYLEGDKNVFERGDE